MNTKYTLTDFSEMMASSLGSDKREIDQSCKAFFILLEEALMRDKVVKINGLGMFKLQMVEKRRSVNIQTGDAVEIPEHYKIVYQPDKDLNERVNGLFAAFESIEVDDLVLSDEVPQASDAVELPEEETELPESVATVDAPEDEPVTDELLAQPIEPIGEPDNKLLPLTDKDPDVLETSPAAPDLSPATAPTETSTVESGEAQPQPQLNEIAPLAVPSAAPVEGLHAPVLRPKERKDWMVYALFFIVLLVGGGGIFLALYLGGERRSPVNLSGEQPVLAADTAPHHEELMLDTSKIAPPIEIKEEPVAAPEPEAEKQPEEVKPTEQVRYDKVVSGDRLTLISLRNYGHKVFWVYIYEENKERIKSPNNVALGTQLVIPPASKYGIDPDDPQSVARAKKKADVLFSTLGE